jgi:hypothetical protein
MFWNNEIIALRNLRKNKAFAAINIIDLALGMTIYVLAGLIARLLVWQFSTPVMLAIAIALSVAFFASKMDLDFFADRIESPIIILLVAGVVAVILAWATVAGHVIRIARANPVLALRYE